MLEKMLPGNNTVKKGFAPMVLWKLLLALPFVIVSISFSQEDILQFYPHADSVTQYPPFTSELSVLCSQKVSGRYVSFIGFKKDKRVLIAAVTLEELKNFSKQIALTVNFDGAKPTAGKISTWGYVFDRNADGKIDYLALVGGAGPYKDKDFPEDFPMRGFPLPKEYIEYLVTRSKIIFNHWGDDNYDGSIDAVIHVDMDRNRDWVDRHLVVRSTDFDSTFNDVWAFTLNDLSARDTVRHTSTAVQYHPVGQPEGEITPKALSEKSAILRLLNRAARACGLTQSNFAPEPQD